MSLNLYLVYVDSKKRTVHEVPIRQLTTTESLAIYGDGEDYKAVRDRYIRRMTEVAERYNYDKMIGELPVYYPHNCPEISVGEFERHQIDVAHMLYGGDYTPVWGVR